MSVPSRLAVGLFSLSIVLLVAACGGSGNSLPGSGSDSQVGSPNVAPQPTAIASESAAAVSAFVDSVGVNVHNGYGSTPYGEDPARISALVKHLGVHHLRDGTYPDQTALCTLDQQYAAAGVHFDFIVSPAESNAQLSAWQSCSAPAAQTYEPYNEYDQSGDPNWVSVLQAADRQVYAFSHGLGLTMPGPALTSEASYAAVGPVTADAGNMHDYFGGYNPGNPGYGSTDKFGTYGSLAYNVAVAQQTTGTAPMWSTETGYGDAPGTQAYVPAVTKMHYEMRTLLDHWNAGVARTYLYELVDEGGGSFGSYGLVNAKTTPKPVFVAIAALLRNLSTKESVPGTLHYTLTVGTAVEHTLLEKRTGSFVLAVWEETSEWNTNTHQPIAVTPQPVTLTFPKAPHSISLTTFADSGTPATQVLKTGTSVSLSVDGGVSLVNISL